MKIAVLSRFGEAIGLVRRMDNAYMAQDVNGADVIFVDDPGFDVTGDNVINTAPGVRGMLADDKMRADVERLLDIVPGNTVSSLYGLFNGTDFSTLIEVSTCNRFMNGGVGPVIGFAMGAGLIAEYPAADVVINWNVVVQFLRSINYRGEVTIPLGNGGALRGLSLMHNSPYFAMYAEMHANGAADMVNYMAGVTAECDVRDVLVIGNLVSEAPYPLINAAFENEIKGDPELDPHMWHVNIGKQSIVVTTAMSEHHYRQAKSRLIHVQKSISKYSPYVQYRTDTGRFLHFLISNSKYREFFRENSVVNQKQEVLTDGKP